MALLENDANGLENQLAAKLGRELTAREKFYLALSEACAPSRLPLSRCAEKDIANIETSAREEQKGIKRDLRRTVGIYKQSQSTH